MVVEEVSGVVEGLTGVLEGLTLLLEGLTDALEVLARVREAVWGCGRADWCFEGTALCGGGYPLGVSVCGGHLGFGAFHNTSALPP